MVRYPCLQHISSLDGLPGLGILPKEGRLRLKATIALIVFQHRDDDNRGGSDEWVEAD